MPQMAPLSWIALFFLFSLTLLLFNTWMFFFMMYNVKNKQLKKPMTLNWKW